VRLLGLRAREGDGELVAPGTGAGAGDGGLGFLYSGLGLDLLGLLLGTDGPAADLDFVLLLLLSWWQSACSAEVLLLLAGWILSSADRLDPAGFLVCLMVISRLSVSPLSSDS